MLIIKTIKTIVIVISSVLLSGAIISPLYAQQEDLTAVNAIIDPHMDLLAKYLLDDEIAKIQKVFLETDQNDAPFLDTINPLLDKIRENIDEITMESSEVSVARIKINLEVITLLKVSMRIGSLISFTEEMHLKTLIAKQDPNSPFGDNELQQLTMKWANMDIQDEADWDETY